MWEERRERVHFFLIDGTLKLFAFLGKSMEFNAGDNRRAANVAVEVLFPYRVWFIALFGLSTYYSSSFPGFNGGNERGEIMPWLSSERYDAKNRSS